MAVTYHVKFPKPPEVGSAGTRSGRHGAPWTPDEGPGGSQANLGRRRQKAPIPASEKQAARKAKTVAELCDLYLADAEAGRLLTRRKVGKKASTIATDPRPDRAPHQGRCSGG